MATDLIEPSELFNKYQHGRVKMIFKIFYVLVLCMKVASALDGLCIYACIKQEIHDDVILPVSCTELRDGEYGISDYR